VTIENLVIQNAAAIGSAGDSGGGGGGGAGALILTMDASTNLGNDFTGGVLIYEGTLELDYSGAAGSGPITFKGPFAELEIASGAIPANTIGGLAIGDKIDLLGLTANTAAVNGSDQFVVSDSGTTAATLQLSGTNSKFYFLPVASAGGTEITALAKTVTVAQFQANEALLDQIPGGFAISDKAAQVSAQLAALNGDPNITAIALTNGGTPALTLTVAQALDDTKALSKISGPYAVNVLDTAAHVSAEFNALNKDHKIKSIALTNGAT
jgi:hypothetical protein